MDSFRDGNTLVESRYEIQNEVIVPVGTRSTQKYDPIFASEFSWMLQGRVEAVQNRFPASDGSAAYLFDFSDYFFVIVLKQKLMSLLRKI